MRCPAHCGAVQQPVSVNLKAVGGGVNVVDKSLPSMQHDASTTLVLPSVHTEPHIGRRCAPPQPRFHFVVFRLFNHWSVVTKLGPDLQKNLRKNRKFIISFS